MVSTTKTYENIEMNFVIKTKDIFGKAQALAQQQSGLLSKAEVLGLCERYIEAIVETVQELEPFEEYTSEMDVYKIYGKIFLFAQEVMIGSLEGTTLGFDLLRWSKNGLEEIDDIASQLLQDVKDGKMLIEDHPCYWNLVIFNILTGEFQNAKGLLQEHSSAPASEAYATVISKLSQIKMSWFEIDSPLTKFKEWQDDLRNLLQTGFFKADTYLSWVVNILTGDMDTFKQLAEENIETWYQILPAVVFFCYPQTELFDIEPVLSQVLSMFTNLELNMLDNVMLAILRNDWIKVSEILLNEVNDFWLAAHIYDTIYKTSPSLLIVDTVNLRDLVVERYAETLFSKGNYVTAIGYFVDANLPNVEELISKRIMETPDMDEESSEILIKICDSVGLTDCRNEIGKRMTKKYLSEDNWINALQWSLSSKNKTSIANVCNTILESASPDEICRLAELEDLMRSSSTIPHALILRKYIQCNLDIRSGELLKGAECLSQIILSNHASTKFTFTLIRDLIMVLGTASNEKISIFDAETCHQLSRFLAFFELDVNRMLRSGDIGNATRKCFENEGDLQNEIRLFKELLINEMTRAFVFKL
uniref:Nuclear pore complex protein Nup85 n=1 Tax=Strongyloides venezuelensis TaxID=75913 RepID=A0A0K0G243_STRVS